MNTTQLQNTDLHKKLIVRFRIILIFLTFAGMSFIGNAEDLQTVPFWQAQQGHWLSENTYMDGKYNRKIAHYGTIFSINVDAEEATVVERKFYPPGHFPGSAVGLEIPETMGVQLIQITKAKTIGSEDAPGSVLFAPLNAYTANSEDRIQPVTDSAALFTSTNTSSNQLTYQMLITLPSPNTRIVVNLGLNQQDKIYELGPLRGVSVFSAVRIELSDVDKEQKLLRERYNTGVVVTTDEDGKFKATWLTKQ
ncbi:hypothetical protein Q4574_07195 [Aliiglaciecola sp. 3_MG-2023]|uniref:hypothetical protein n=1 Tax=Aliiglaciecola sp. 3_MG-2023 TaxID=3062644 RepID=UPI0026E281B9|nr:hypothetical protein [Aliiglaciecola sp. 3_MG-2023]MDO6693064.1 hypothetical protein [Aliiglaciecola sp. 3_MG-2023]